MNVFLFFLSRGSLSIANIDECRLYSRCLGHISEQTRLLSLQPLTHQGFKFKQRSKIIRNYQSGWAKHLLIMVESEHCHSRLVLIVSFVRVFKFVFIYLGKNFL